MINEEFDRLYGEEEYLGDVQDNLCSRITNDTVYSGAVVSCFEWGVDKVVNTHEENPLQERISELKSENSSLSFQNKILKDEIKNLKNK